MLRPSVSSSRSGSLGAPCRAAAIEVRDLQRNGDLGAEFLRLAERAAGERQARNAGRKAEIVLDARRCPGLAAERALIQHDDRKPLGGRIDRGRETRRAGADHSHVIGLGQIELGRDAETHAGFGIGRPLQHRAVRTDHHRQFVGLHAGALYQFAAPLRRSRRPARRRDSRCATGSFAAASGRACPAGRSAPSPRRPPAAARRGAG